MIVISGAELVLPDRVMSPGTLVIDGDRIADIRPGATGTQRSGTGFQNHYVVPGFIDVHVHGVDGIDAHDSGDAISTLAARMPRYGVTAFCPTSIACTPGALGALLAGVRSARERAPAASARVLPAHIESNFISHEYRGAQPAACLRSPRQALTAWTQNLERDPGVHPSEEFDGAAILRELERAAPDVFLVTIAPELDGGVELVSWLVARGFRVSLGHSAATYDDARAAIAAGASHATHLFNRMAPVAARSPGLIGAVLQADEVICEIIGDGVHVHPSLVRTVVRAKPPGCSVAITDATAVAGLRAGAQARLGGQRITAGDRVAMLDDGTVAGSVATMDRVFRTLVGPVGLSPVEAVSLCASAPAREVGLVGHGVLAPGASADITVLDDRLNVVQTYVGGQLVYVRG